MILFVLLLINGVLVDSLNFLWPMSFPTILGSVTGLCSGIFVIIALVRQHNSDLPGSLRTITWATLGFVGVTFMSWVTLWVWCLHLKIRAALTTSGK